MIGSGLGFVETDLASATPILIFLPLGVDRFSGAVSKPQVNGEHRFACGTPGRYGFGQGTVAYVASWLETNEGVDGPGTGRGKRQTQHLGGGRAAHSPAVRVIQAASDHQRASLLNLHHSADHSVPSPVRS